LAAGSDERVEQPRRQAGAQSPAANRVDVDPVSLQPVRWRAVALEDLGLDARSEQPWASVSPLIAPPITTMKQRRDRLGLNRTDLRCLGVLAAGGLTAGQFGHAAGLSPGAATTAVDRLVRTGYARRVRDAGDRRQVTVEPTAAARAAFEQVWGPIGSEARRRLSRRTSEELTLIRKFLAEGRQLQTRHAERIKGDDSRS
jgi:DNA-binding MarR family transcriptional regulator